MIMVNSRFHFPFPTLPVHQLLSSLNVSRLYHRNAAGECYENKSIGSSESLGQLDGVHILDVQSFCLSDSLSHSQPRPLLIEHPLSARH